MNNLRVAIVTFNSPVAQSLSNIERMIKWVKEAKKQDASVICFPEMNITGYSTGKKIYEAAEPVPGSITDAIVRTAKKEDIVILAGIAEKDKKERVYVTHLVVKPNGSVETYRKLHLSPPEQNIYTAGKNIPLFETSGIKFGIQLCYDAHFPELSTQMAVNGVDVIFMPHASPRGTSEDKFRSWMRHLPARAFDNGIYILACNQTGDNNEGLNFPGISIIIGPSGEVINKDISGQEALLIADIKAEELENIRKHRMRYFLPNRRPEIY